MAIERHGSSVRSPFVYDNGYLWALREDDGGVGMGISMSTRVGASRGGYGGGF